MGTEGGKPLEFREEQTATGRKAGGFFFRQGTQNVQADAPQVHSFILSLGLFDGVPGPPPLSPPYFPLLTLRSQCETRSSSFKASVPAR